MGELLGELLCGTISETVGIHRNPCTDRTGDSIEITGEIPSHFKFGEVLWMIQDKDHIPENTCGSRTIPMR